MTPPPFRYRPHVLEELGQFGFCPMPVTPPTRVREWLSDLYRWELRALRDQLMARRFPKSGYAERVVALRRRYRLLSVPVEAWTEPRDPGGGPASP